MIRIASSIIPPSWQKPSLRRGQIQVLLNRLRKSKNPRARQVKKKGVGHGHLSEKACSCHPVRYARSPLGLHFPRLTTSYS